MGPLSSGMGVVIVFCSSVILVLSLKAKCCYWCSCHYIGVVLVVIDLVLGFVLIIGVTICVAIAVAYLLFL